MSFLTDLGDGIYLLDAHYVTDQVASIYLMQQGSHIAIIETGTAHSVPYIEQALEELNSSFDHVQYIIPTHIHLDHAGGAGELMQFCRHAQLLVHPRGAPHLINPEKLEAGTKAVYGEDKFAQLYGSLTPVEQSRVMPIEDNEIIDFNGRTLRFIHTPGHALHHFCIVDEVSQGIFTGDNFGLAYQQLVKEGVPFIFATTTPVHFDPDAMKQSIDRIMSFSPKQLFLTHFGCVKPNDQLIAQLKQSIDAFVEIAMQFKEHTDHRVEMIQSAVLQWLLTQLKDHPLGERQLIHWLQTDALLNAQGLDVWLQRLAKHS